MAKLTKNTTQSYLTSKVIVTIGIVASLSLAIIIFTNWVSTPNKNNPYFTYGTTQDPKNIIHVIDDKIVEVPIFFDIDKGIVEVNLAFSGDHDQMTGLTISDKTVPVINGKAVSKVIFQFNSEIALKAGTHFLTVLARDKATGKVLRKGEIRFTYNIQELIGKCSC